eukprot:403362531
MPIYAAGLSDDQTTIGFNTNNPIPIIISIDSFGKQRWAKSLTYSGNAQQSIIQLKLMKSQQYLIGIGDSFLLIYMISVVDGQLINNYDLAHNLNSYSSSKMGFDVDDQNNIYLASYKTSSQYGWAIFSFTLQVPPQMRNLLGTLAEQPAPYPYTPFDMRYNIRQTKESDDAVYGLMLSGTQKYFYATGQMDISSYNYPVIASYDSQTGKQLYIYSNQYYWNMWYDYYFTLIDVIQESTNSANDIIHSVFQKRIDGNYYQVTYFQRLRFLSGSSVDQTKFITMPTEQNPLVLKSISDKECYLLSQVQDSSQLIIYNVNFYYSSNKIQMTKYLLNGISMIVKPYIGTITLTDLSSSFQEYCPTYKKMIPQPQTNTFECTINNTQTVISHKPFMIDDSKCEDVSIEYTMSYQMNVQTPGVDISKVFSFDNKTEMITCSGDNEEQVALYQVEITGKALVNDPKTGALVDLHLETQKVEYAVDVISKRCIQSSVASTLQLPKFADITYYIPNNALNLYVNSLPQRVKNYITQVPIVAPLEHQVYKEMNKIVDLNCKPTNTSCLLTPTYELVYFSSLSSDILNKIKALQPFSLIFSGDVLGWSLQSAFSDKQMYDIINATSYSLDVEIMVNAKLGTGIKECYAQPLKININDNYCKDKVVNPKPILQSNKTYVIGDPALTLSFNDWQDTDPFCGEFTYKLEIFDVDQTTIGEQLLSFITFDSNTRQVSIYTTNLTIQTYKQKIRITGTIPNQRSNFSDAIIQIINPCQGKDLISMDDISETYFVRDPNTTIKIPIIEVDEPEYRKTCMTIYFRHINEPSNALTSIITKSVFIDPDYVLTVYATELNQAGEYKYKVLATFNQITKSYYYTLTIKIKDQCMGPVKVSQPSLTHYLSPKNSYYQLNAWSTDPDYLNICDPLTYQLKFESSTSSKYNDFVPTEDQPFPGFMDFDGNIPQIIANTIDMMDLGVYTFTLIGETTGLNNSLKFQFNVEDPCQNVQVIRRTVNEYTYINGIGMVVFIFPKWVAQKQECNDFTYSLDLSNDAFKQIVELNSIKREVSILASDPTIGNQTIIATLIGSAYYGKFSENFKINFMTPRGFTSNSSSNSSVVVINGTIIDKKKVKQSMTARIVSVSNYGKAKIDFNKELMQFSILDQEYQHEIMELYLIQDQSSIQILYWKMSYISDSSIEIDLNFTKPKMISNTLVNWHLVFNYFIEL